MKKEMIEMKKGILIIGKNKMENRMELSRIFSEEVGTHLRSLLDDGVENQVILLNSIDLRLKSDSLEGLVQPIFDTIENVNILASLHSIELLTKEDLDFAKEHFEIRLNVGRKEYVELSENEVYVQGVPVRLYMLEKTKDSPQFFRDYNEKALVNASIILNHLYKSKADFKRLQTLLYNPAGEGQSMVSEASITTEKSVKDACRWFEADYFTGAKGMKNASKTYENCFGVRLFVDNLVISHSK